MNIGLAGIKQIKLMSRPETGLGSQGNHGAIQTGHHPNLIMPVEMKIIYIFGIAMAVGTICITIIPHPGMLLSMMPFLFPEPYGCWVQVFWA